MVNDPVADFITRLYNAGKVNKNSVEIPYSRFKHAVADTLEKAGFIGKVEKGGKDVRKSITVELLYKQDGSPRISGVQRISKPGRRLYKGAKEIFQVRYGKGAVIFSTPKGVMTGDDARRENVGGEELFKIW